MEQKECKLLLSYSFAHKHSSAGRRLRLLNDRHLQKNQWFILTSNLSESSQNNVIHAQAPFTKKFPPVSYKSSYNKTLLKKLLTFFLWPDRGIFWIPKAYKKASKKVKEHPSTRLVASGYPFSSILLGALIKFKNQKKVFFIAHYIDAFYLINKGNGTPFYFIPLNYICERFVNNQANIIIVNHTKKEQFLKVFPQHEKKARFVNELPGRILNFDNPKFEQNRYFYAGSLYKKFRNPKTVLELFKYTDSNLILAGNLNDCDNIMKGFYSSKIKHIGMIDTQEIEKQYKACEFLVNIDNQDSAQQPPGKIIEYMLLQKPIINFYKKNSISGHVLKAHSLNKNNYLEVDLAGSFEKNLSLIKNFNPVPLPRYYKVGDEYKKIFEVYNNET